MDTLDGYSVKPKYRDVEHKPEGWEEGDPILKVTVRRNLTLAQKDAFFAADGNQSQLEANALMAPYIVAWNVMGEEAITDDEGNITGYQTVPLPPPAEAGPDIFRAADLDGEDLSWLFMEVKFAHIGGAAVFQAYVQNEIAKREADTANVVDMQETDAAKLKNFSAASTKPEGSSDAATRKPRSVTKPKTSSNGQ
jgi:hypothetical protein